MITMCGLMSVFFITSLVLNHTSADRDNYVEGRNRIHVRQRIVLSNGNKNLDKVDEWYKSYLQSVMWFNPNDSVGWENTENSGIKNRRPILSKISSVIEKHTENDNIYASKVEDKSLRKEKSLQTLEKFDRKPSTEDKNVGTEMVSHKSPEETEKPRFFRPVSTNWKISQCLRFNFNCNVGAMVLKKTPSPTALTKPKDLRDVASDGNCWYRCLSMWIDGTEVYHEILRNKVYKFMLKDKRVHDFVGDIDEYLEKNPINILGTWSTEIDIFATAIMMNICIYVYSDTYKSWQLFGKNGDFADHVDPEEECLYMTHVNGNHFEVVDSVE